MRIWPAIPLVLGRLLAKLLGGDLRPIAQYLATGSGFSSPMIGFRTLPGWLVVLESSGYPAQPARYADPEEIIAQSCDGGRAGAVVIPVERGNTMLTPCGDRRCDPCGRLQRRVMAVLLVAALLILPYAVHAPWSSSRQARSACMSRSDESGNPFAGRFSRRGQNWPGLLTLIFARGRRPRRAARRMRLPDWPTFVQRKRVKCRRSIPAAGVAGRCRVAALPAERMRRSHCPCSSGRGRSSAAAAPIVRRPVGGATPGLAVVR